MTVDEQLRSLLAYEANANAVQVAADIAVMEQFDRENEKKQKLWLMVGIGGILLLGCGFVAAIALQDQDSMPMIAGGGAVVGLVAAIVGFFLWARFGKFNLEDMRYLVLGNLVRLLKTDMKEEDTFQIRVSFRPHNHKSNYQRSGAAGRWNAKFYQHPWLTIAGRLLDGAKFCVTITEKQQDRHRTKTSASGKLKTKHKTKNSGEAAVSIKFKSKRYPRFAGGQTEVHQALQLPDGVILKSLDSTDESLTLRVKYGGHYASGADEAKARKYVDLTASMLLSCYHILNQSRRAT
jgi:hypothetical protein